jgi:hypothetical protein
MQPLVLACCRVLRLVQGIAAAGGAPSRSSSSPRSADERRPAAGRALGSLIHAVTRSSPSGAGGRKSRSALAVQRLGVEEGTHLAHRCRQVAVAAPAYGCRARRRRVEAQDHPHGGGLAGAVAYSVPSDQRKPATVPPGIQAGVDERSPDPRQGAVNRCRAVVGHAASLGGGKPKHATEDQPCGRSGRGSHASAVKSPQYALSNRRTCPYVAMRAAAACTSELVIVPQACRPRAVRASEGLCRRGARGAYAGEVVQRGHDHLPADGEGVPVRMVSVLEFAGRVHHVAVLAKFLAEPFDV